MSFDILSKSALQYVLTKLKGVLSDVALSGSYNDLLDKPTIPPDNSVKDYNNNVSTKFGYSTSGMAQSAVKWLGAWDASVSGEYRLRAVKQADLRVSYASSAGAVAWSAITGKPSTYTPASGSNDYCKVVQNSNFDDFAKQYFAMGMHSNATGNPTGASKWCHGITMAWGTNTNTSWISQIALDVHDGTGMFYRTTSGSIVGRAWTQLLDNAKTVKPGALILQANSTFNSYNEGLRINRGSNGYATIAIGGATDSTDGTGDGQWWIGCNPASYGRKLMIGHNGSTDTDAYFFARTNTSKNIELSVSAMATPGTNIPFRKSTGSAYITLYAAAFTTQSSRKYKENIVDMTEERALELLLLRPVTFDYKEDIVTGDRHDYNGLIAEEAVEHSEHAVFYNDKGEIEGIDYSKFVPQLIKMVQIQQKQIDDLTKRIEELEAKV